MKALLGSNTRVASNRAYETVVQFVHLKIKNNRRFLILSGGFLTSRPQLQIVEVLCNMEKEDGIALKGCKLSQGASKMVDLCDRLRNCNRKLSIETNSWLAEEAPNLNFNLL